MASYSVKFKWCACHKHKIPSKDTHDRCLHCLGIQHAKEAVLEYGKCPHCASMDWSTCINRLTKLQEALHRERQERKTETTQAGPKPAAAPKPTVAPAPISTSKVAKDPVPTLPVPNVFTATSAQPSVLPVMLTILSPPPAQEKRSRRGSTMSPKDRMLLEMVQQKLDAQWASMERRVEALERRNAETAPEIPATPTLDQASLSTVALASTSSPEEDHKVDHEDWYGPHGDREAVRAPLAATVKEEEEPMSIRPSWKAEEASEGEETSHPPEDTISGQDILVAAELQGLISRAAKYLGISFPNTGANSPSPGPRMVPDFENLVQSTWSNPASSRPFRELFSKMYRMHENQAPAYDRMPQVSRFMSAIFQAVQPAENAMVPQPSKHWRCTEIQAEKMYQTASMLVRTANYLHYLSNYQQRLLEEVAEDQPAQRLVAILEELKLIARFSFQLSSHQAELSGRVMAGSVAIRRQVWMATTNYTDSLKATVADLPYVVQQTVEASTGPTCWKPEVP
ncbi:hypothetical protein GN956_G23549 [Arapaima gigas]